MHLLGGGGYFQPADLVLCRGFAAAGCGIDSKGHQVIIKEHVTHCDAGAY